MNDATRFQTGSIKSDQFKVGQKEYTKKGKVTFKVEKSNAGYSAFAEVNRGLATLC